MHSFFWTLLLLAVPNYVFCGLFDFLTSRTRADLNFTELVAYDGYKSEKYDVVTKDGYVLTIFRVLKNSACDSTINKPPILYQHGLYMSSDDCLMPGPGVAHCYTYSDNCYDVWVGNTRGNRYSRKHITKNPDTDDSFWDFSFTEFGEYDIPAVIDYILNETNQEQLIFVGHSEGVGSLLVLTSKKPEYNKKIKVGFGMSPTTTLTHSRLPMVTVQTLVAQFTDITKAEIFEHGGAVQTVASKVCGRKINYYLCSAILFSILGYNNFQITKDVFPVIVGHSPAGISLKNFGHWGQTVNGFRDYDYNKEKNLEIYGQEEPPKFELDKVSMEWVFLCSENDYVSDLKDVKVLRSQLTGTKLCVVEDKSFGHLDFMYGQDIPKLVTSKILGYLETGELKCGN